MHNVIAGLINWMGSANAFLTALVALHTGLSLAAISSSLHRVGRAIQRAQRADAMQTRLAGQVGKQLLQQ